MENELGSVLDLAICVILLAICMSTGVISVVESHYSITSFKSSYEDKTVTAKYTPSEKIYGTYDGTLTKAEVIMVSQIQDADMPRPNILNLEKTESDGTKTNAKIEITENYKSVLDREHNTKAKAAVTQLWKLLKDDAENSAYVYEYDYTSGTYRISAKKTVITGGTKL